MYIAFIIVAVLFVLGLLILAKIAHGIFKLISFIISLLVLVGMVIGGIVVYDAYKFNQMVSKQPMAYILVSDSSVLSAIALNPAKEELIQLSNEEINAFSNGRYSQLLDKYYKLWVFDLRVVDDLKDEEFELGGITLTKSQLRDALVSDDPVSVLAPPGTEFNQTPNEIKGMLFAGVVVSEARQNPVFILEEYKKGSIKVIEESPLFRFIRIIPLSYMKRVFERAAQQISERVNK
ncbi:hypothetical protein KY318_04045 [Candidatus Woesearchaeota archaeon]|nr:hypothetical protein [Candidatus Woesearchaeota archaeon]